MSLLIKGMEMPKDCGHCLLCEQDTIYEALVYRCLVTDSYLDDGCEHQIMKDCPLVPVPPHGRLIDADALVDSFDPSDFWNPDAEDNCFAAIHVVNCAPTIIEAELPVHHGTFAATSEQEALKRIIPAEEGEI